MPLRATDRKPARERHEVGLGKPGRNAAVPNTFGGLGALLGGVRAAARGLKRKGPRSLPTFQRIYQRSEGPSGPIFTRRNRRYAFSTRSLHGKFSQYSISEIPQ